MIDFIGFLDISKNIEILQEFSFFFITLVLVILIYQGLNNFWLYKIIKILKIVIFIYLIIKRKIIHNDYLGWLFYNKSSW